MTKICIELMNGKRMFFKLFPDTAPITVANFLHLVDIHYFDGTIFHRVIKGFMSQGGGYTLTEDKSGIMAMSELYQIPGEFEANGFENDIAHEIGVISMARTDNPNSAFAQFFICSTNARFLDGQYAAFGRIIDQESLNVAEELNSIKTSNIGSSFSDYPNGAGAEDITIKTIYKL